MLKTVVLVGFFVLAVTFWGILKRRVGHSQAINTAKFCSGLNVTHRFSRELLLSPSVPRCFSTPLMGGGSTTGHARDTGSRMSGRQT